MGVPSTWKKIELDVCRELNGERTGPVGKDGPDCTKATAPYAVQVKHREVPKWLTDAMEQAEFDCWDDFLPTLVLHPKGEAVLDSLIIFRLRDFRDWFISARKEDLTDEEEV